MKVEQTFSDDFGINAGELVDVWDCEKCHRRSRGNKCQHCMEEVWEEARRGRQYSTERREQN